MEEHKDPGEEISREEEKEQEYSFLQETIKDETVSKKKVKKDIFRMAGLGLVFGLVASLSFSAFKPWMDELFHSNPQKVTIPEEEEEEDEATPEDEPEATQQVLDAESYRQMQQSLTSVASEANKSVVEIAGTTGDQDWMNDSYDHKNSTAGLIIADNGQELLVFGKTSIIKEAGDVHIIFSDGHSYKASLKKKDGNLDFGIYAVSRGDIQDTTWSQIKAATLGSSNSVSKGDPAIVLGSPFGYAGAVGFGTVASSKNSAEFADGQYRLICTDIAGARNGSGVIVNLKGEIIGIIDQSISEEDSMNLVTGFGISDIKEMMQFLLNGQGVPYIGIRGVDVTQEIEDQGIPRGVYVKEVETDSPAMAAGIQCGDIITNINGTDVATVATYHAALMDLESGKKIKIRGHRQGAGGYVDIDFGVTIGSKE